MKCPHCGHEDPWITHSINCDVVVFIDPETGQPSRVPDLVEYDHTEAVWDCCQHPAHLPDTKITIGGELFIEEGQP